MCSLRGDCRPFALDPKRELPPHSEPPPQPQPPPRPPRLPPPPSPAPSLDTNFPILSISIIGILTTSILLLGYYVIVIKCCFNWRRSDVIIRLSGSRRRSENPIMAYVAATRSRGLEESAIRAIPTFRYRCGGGGGGEEGKRSFHECAVCLNEFQEEERIRLLPNCLHMFHIDCIDTWLQTHANCPLCRSDITATTPLPTDHLRDLASHQNLQHSGDIVLEISNDGIDGVQPLSGSTNSDPSPRKAEQSSGEQKKGRKFHHGSSMGDECIDARGEDERFSFQPMRRSFSMDSSGDRQLYMAVQNILQQNPHFQQVSSGESSSNSGRIRRTFFSFGQCRGSRSSVLPI